MHRYTQNKFDPKNTTSTTGAFFVSKKVYVDGIRVRLQLWDTAGQERFRSMVSPNDLATHWPTTPHSPISHTWNDRHRCITAAQTPLSYCMILPMLLRLKTSKVGLKVPISQAPIPMIDTDLTCHPIFTELKSNCSPDLIIYIVGSKADLHRHRQVTQDLARLSLHKWFPPPKPPTPPPPPPSSTFSYIRPRFTSFPTLRSAPIAAPIQKVSLSPSPETDDSYDSRSSALSRSTTAPSYIRPRAKSGGLLLPRSNSSAATSPTNQSRFGPHYGTVAWNDHADSSSNSYQDDDEDDEEDSEEWGLQKGMELFEVSAKDDVGMSSCRVIVSPEGRN